MIDDDDDDDDDWIAEFKHWWSTFHCCLQRCQHWRYKARYRFTSTDTVFKAFLPFSALTLLVVRQEGYQACKN